MNELQATLIILALITARVILPGILTIIFGKIIDRFAVNI